MEKCSLLIKNTIVMTDYETVKNGMDIAISGDRIVAVVESGTREFQAEKTISGEGKLFMPGLIDSHMHTGQQLLKGLVLDAKPIIWTRVMLPFESTLTPEKMKLSAEVAALEMMKSGTTGFIDAGSYFMDAATAVYEKSGLRGCLSYSTMDEEGLPESIAMNAAQAVEETDRLYADWNEKGNLKVYYSLRALNSCSDELTELAAGHAKERGAMLQAHMNEYQGEIDGIIKREGMRPYEYLEKMGVLSEKFLGAHSLILSEEEKQLVKERGVKICHCPFSNCGKAVPDTPDLVERGIIPGFGTDGAAHGGLSLWSEMRIFRSLMNIYHGVPNRNPKVMPAELLFRMLWEGGAAAINEAGQCGRIEEGYKADLIGINLEVGRLLPSGNLLHTMFECGDSGDVRDMIVGGKVLMENREVKTLDEERIQFEIKEYMKKGRRFVMIVLLMTAAANLVVGALVGLCGVAGFLLPMFYTASLGMNVSEGLALSFAAFIVSGALGSYNYKKAGNLDLAFGLRLSIGSLAGAVLGVRLNLIIPEGQVKMLLYLVVLLSGISILLRKEGRKESTNSSGKDSGKTFSIEKNLPMTLLIGFLTGAICSMSGAGGPVLVMPLLVVFGIPIRTAVGVALFNSIFIGIPAVVGYLTQCDMIKILPILAAALLAHAVGVFYGSRNAERINQGILKKGVAVFSIVIAVCKLSGIL